LAAGDDALASVRPFLDLVPNWAAFIGEDEDDSFNALVRGHASAGRPLGSDAFVASLGRQLNRSLKRKKPRPKIQQRDKRNLDLFGNAKRS
jgi:putative transposase